jgi:hypothetical protein
MTPHVFATGIDPVVALSGPFIQKIFPPLLPAQLISKCASLSPLRGRLLEPPSPRPGLLQQIQEQLIRLVACRASGGWSGAFEYH